MSHGHDHSEYNNVPGGTPGVNRGLLLVCDGAAPKSGEYARVVERSYCAQRPYPEACATCEHSRFVLEFQSQIGNQEVACPRWKSEEEKAAHKKPHYLKIYREICLTKRPLPYCYFCPNKDGRNPPETQEGWWEERAIEKYGTVYK